MQETSQVEHLIIVGRTRENRANMTSVMMSGCERCGVSYSRVDDAPFPLVWSTGHSSFPANTAVVLVSTAKRFPTVLTDCERLQLPLVVATSNIDIPKNVKTVVISAPNLGLLVNAMFDAFPRFCALAKSLNAESQVGEFHQSTKSPGSITAFKFAEMLGVPRERVGSGRSDALAQVFLGVPAEYASGFARIGMLVEAYGVKARITLETNGREAYFLGLMALLRKYFECRDMIGAGVWTADRLMFNDVE